MAQRDRHDREPLQVAQPGPCVELVSDGVEEHVAEAERHRAADDRELQVDDRADRHQRASDQHAGALDDRPRGALRRPPGLVLDRLAAAVRLEAAEAAAHARPAVGLDDHVADVAGVADPSLQQPAAGDDAATDAGGRPRRR